MIVVIDISSHCMGKIGRQGRKWTLAKGAIRDEKSLLDYH